MRWPWRRRGVIEPRPMVSRAMELETAKEILAEVFHARPGEVEEMIQRRLEDRMGRILESLRMSVKDVSIFLAWYRKRKAYWLYYTCTYGGTVDNSCRALPIMRHMAPTDPITPLGENMRNPRRRNAPTTNIIRKRAR